MLVSQGSRPQKPTELGDIVKITVLNGSPKGEIGVTLQYVKYIQKHHPGCEFEVFHVGREIKNIERKPERWQAIIDTVADSQAVIWCTPVYILLVPSQLKRFIELVFERGAQGAFAEKYATTFTTSAHFYDHTAHNYMRAVCEDLQMRYVDGYSAEFNDLLRPDERKQIRNFADGFFGAVETGKPTCETFMRIPGEMPDYEPGEVEDVTKDSGRKIVLVTDAAEGDSNLQRMTETFLSAVTGEVEVINLHELNMRGGCLGCLNCIYEGICMYKDGVRDVVEGKILPADAVVYAGSIRDRYLSARWKMFIDRMFYNGHRPVIGEKPTAWMISGPLKQIPNLRQTLEAYSENPRSRNVGIVTDECEDSGETTALIKALADDLMWAIDVGLSKPPSFLGVGGHKVFRDLIYSMRGIFKADHEFYRENRMYDFPLTDLKVQAMNLLFFSMRRIPSMRKQMYKDANKRMIMPLERVLRK